MLIIYTLAIVFNVIACILHGVVGRYWMMAAHTAIIIALIWMFA